jgi:hypothetical protein
VGVELEFGPIPQILPFGLASELVCGKMTKFRAPTSRANRTAQFSEVSPSERLGKLPAPPSRLPPHLPPVPSLSPPPQARAPAPVAPAAGAIPPLRGPRPAASPTSPSHTFAPRPAPRCAGEVRAPAGSSMRPTTPLVGSRFGPHP